jgi:hypothetical protein
MNRRRDGWTEVNQRAHIHTYHDFVRPDSETHNARVGRQTLWPVRTRPPDGTQRNSSGDSENSGGVNQKPAGGEQGRVRGGGERVSEGEGGRGLAVNINTHANTRTRLESRSR